MPPAKAHNICLGRFHDRGHPCGRSCVGLYCPHHAWQDVLCHEKLAELPRDIQVRILDFADPPTRPPHDCGSAPRCCDGLTLCLLVGCGLMGLVLALA